MKIHCQKLAMFIHQFEENIKSVLKFVTFTGVLVSKFYETLRKGEFYRENFKYVRKKNSVDSFIN